jgi:hypothetical protein
VSNALLNRAWRVPLRTAPKIVLIRLADAAGKDGRCWLSVNTLATECGQSRRLVFRHLDEIERLGHIHREHRAGRPSVVHVHPKAIDEPMHTQTPLPGAAESPPEALPGAAQTPTRAHTDTPPGAAGTPEPIGTSMNLERRTPVWIPRLQRGWWTSSTGIDHAARALGFDIAKLGAIGYPELKERCFSRLSELRAAAEGKR